MHSAIIQKIPNGISVVDDIGRRLPNYRLATIFDVGANVGQSASEYVSAYPSSVIYCFEPVSQTFSLLKSNMIGKEQVRYFQLAFGAKSGTVTMTAEGASTMNFIVDESNEVGRYTGKTEEVTISTLDEFCEAQRIQHISYLKIDTEGGDLNVLNGATKLLTSKQIDLVELEAGMNPHNKRHIPFETLKQFMEHHDYFIFGIYEQVSEWPDKKPHLRRVNPVFISAEVIRQHTAV